MKRPTVKERAESAESALRRIALILSENNPEGIPRQNVSAYNLGRIDAVVEMHKEGTWK